MKLDIVPKICILGLVVAIILAILGLCSINGSFPAPLTLVVCHVSLIVFDVLFIINIVKHGRKP